MPPKHLHTDALALTKIHFSARDAPLGFLARPPWMIRLAGSRKLAPERPRANWAFLRVCSRNETVGAMAGRTLRLRPQGFPLRRVSGMRYRQARLSIPNCQRLGYQVLSVYHCSPNREEGSELYCLMRSRPEKQSVSRQNGSHWTTSHHRRFQEAFMNKLGRQRPTSTHQLQTYQTSPPATRICPERN